MPSAVGSAHAPLSPATTKRKGWRTGAEAIRSAIEEFRPGVSISPSAVRLVGDHYPTGGSHEVPDADPPRRSAHPVRGGVGPSLRGGAEPDRRRLPGDQPDPGRDARHRDAASADRHHRARGGRPDAHNRWALRRGQGGTRRLLPVRGGRPRRRHRGRFPRAGRPARRRGGGSARRGVVAILDRAFRDEWPRILAGLIGFLGDFDLAEEAAQDAFATAAERWPRDGTPDHPRAWLMTTARKSAIAGIPFRVPPAHLLPDRLAAVLAVVYLIFNEGYGGRGDLAAEAIRLGRVLAELMPDEPEVHGLLALMLVNDARRDARFEDGAVVLLRDQDRTLWDLDQIEEGRAALDRALALRGRGAYVLQAAIAVLHTDEPRDWPQIAALYGELARPTGPPVVELNRAAAVAEAGDPGGG